MIETISQISDQLVARLDAEGWPPLRDLVNGETGKIIIGKKHKLDQFLPPRIVFTPLKSGFGSRDTTRGQARVADNTAGYDAQSKVAIGHPAIFTEKLTFKVSVWGVATEDEDDPAGADFEYTQALYHELIAACHVVMKGCFELEDGIWETVSHVKREGQEFVFGITVNLPVLKVPGPRAGVANRSAPAGVAPHVTDSMVIGTGDESPGCEDED